MKAFPCLAVAFFSLVAYASAASDPSGNSAASAAPGTMATGDVVLLPDFVVDASKFVHTIPVRTRVATEGFQRGDGIRIVSVRGDRERLEPGGTYIVEGVYTLKSTSTGLVALSLTTYGGGGKTLWTKKQVARIDAGSGEFSLIATMPAAGEFHVSFYFPSPSDLRKQESSRTAKASGAADSSASDVVRMPAYVVEATTMLSRGVRGGIYFQNR